MKLPGLPFSLEGRRPPLRSLAPGLNNADHHEVESHTASQGHPDETDGRA